MLVPRTLKSRAITATSAQGQAVETQHVTASAIANHGEQVVANKVKGSQDNHQTGTATMAASTRAH
jgi:hypothetical protein